jgi:type I restriction enzyme R subunit
MAPMPEQQAREAIDLLLATSGWAVQDLKLADLQAARGVAPREFKLTPGAAPPATCSMSAAWPTA